MVLSNEQPWKTVPFSLDLGSRLVCLSLGSHIKVTRCEIVKGCEMWRHEIIGVARSTLGSAQATGEGEVLW